MKTHFEGNVPCKGGLGEKSECRRLFVYGSNMNTEQVEARCGARPEVLGPARLPGYRLAFFGHSKRWDGGLETVERESGETVWGVVYELPFADAERLDTFQDVRLDGGGSYFHYPVEVETADGEKLEAVLYKKDQDEEATEPSAEYLAFIARGAMEHGLPTDYVARLRAVSSHPAQYEVPRKSKYDALLGAGCANCGDLRASKGGPGFKAGQKPE